MLDTEHDENRRVENEGGCEAGASSCRVSLVWANRVRVSNDVLSPIDR